MAQNEYHMLPFGSNGPSWFDGTAAPGSGNYAVGDFCFNSTPSPGVPFGWICTVASVNGAGAVWDAVLGSIKPVAVTTTYAILADDGIILANATGGAFAVTLPTAVNIKGKIYRIKKTDATANAVTINTTSSQTIDGLTSRLIYGVQDNLSVMSDGANWQRIERKTDAIKTVTVLYTATDNDETIIADATSGAYSVTLPTAVGNAGKKFTVKRVTAAANLITVATVAGNIDGSATYTGLSAQNKYVTVQSDGANYFIIANN